VYRSILSGTLLALLGQTIFGGAALASVVETSSPLTGSTTSITFNSLAVTGSTPAGTVNVGGDAFSATSPSQTFILSGEGVAPTGSNQFLSTDNGASFSSPDNLTITPASGVSQIAFTYGTFNLFGPGAFTPTTISATVNTTSGSANFTLPNATNTAEFIGFLSTSMITSIVLSGLAPLQDGRFPQSTEIDLLQVSQNAVATTPLPAALVLFGSGILGLAAVARRREKISL
jgi:hypothetical protein